jgi:hypothetical protein
VSSADEEEQRMIKWGNEKIGCNATMTEMKREKWKSREEMSITFDLSP